MTETDKIEIDNLLNSAKEMKEYATKMNGLYVDEKIAKFATEAKLDYINNKDYIKKIIQENLGLFFNLKNFEVSDSGGCCCGTHAMRGESFGVRVKGTNLKLTAILTNATTIKNTGYDVYFDVRGMSILDVRWYTSDCDDKENYNICSNWDLVDIPHSEVAQKPLESAKNTKDWNILYNLACATRAKNKQLVSRFKECLQFRINEFRASANKSEATKNALNRANKNYTKVDL